MCRAIRVLCAAADPQRLAELKRGAVSGSWELVGGATSVGNLAAQIEEWGPDVVALDAPLGPEAIVTIRGATKRVRIVSVGPLAGADATAASPAELRTAVLGLSGPGGPVRV